MTKTQLHLMALKADDIWTELNKLDNCPLIDLWDAVDRIRAKACDLSSRLDEFDETTAEDFGAGIKMED